MSKLIMIKNKLVRFGTKLGAVATLPPVAPMTLRFQFGDKAYNPITAGVGSSGTWAQVSHPSYNIWDWTNENTSWATAFGGGSISNPGAFADYENNKVKVIDAGDTSTVTDFSRLFQNCFAITEVSAPIDTSNASTAYLMFSRCENCTVFPDLDLRNATVQRGASALYQRCYKMARAPSILFPSTPFSMFNLFFRCYSLSYVPLYDTSSCTEMQGTFYMCSSLERIPQFNTANVANMNAIFGLCANLVEVPMLDTRNVANMLEAFACCEKLEEIPAFNITKSCNMTSVFDAFDDVAGTFNSSLKSIPNWDWSKATSLEKAFRGCTELTAIPEMAISSSITSVAHAFENCHNIETGIKSMYDALVQIPSIQESSKHVDCFKNCGTNTPEGRAQLEQIPVSWGGLLQE